MELTLDKVRMQLERLRRHHKAVIWSHDEVALLDLAHALRVWADMKLDLASVLPVAKTTRGFKVASPARGTKDFVRGYAHVIAYMPGGVTTYASRGDVMTIEGADQPPWGQGPSSLVVEAPYVGAYRSLRQAVLSFREKADETKGAFGQPNISRCNFAEWLGGEAVRIALPGDKPTPSIITRESLIRRVANTLGASHATSDSDKPLDEQIALMMRLRLAGLPLPHFLLVKTAEDLLPIADRWLAAAGPTSKPPKSTVGWGHGPEFNGKPA